MVIDMDGPPCQGNCPNRGCVEALASGTALAREALRIAARAPGLRARRGRSSDGRELAGPLVTELAHDGDRAAIEVLELIGERLGVAIASFVNIFNPEVVVIGGGVIAAGELLLAPARAVVAAARACRRRGTRSGSSPARFGVEAGMIGAAALAFDGLWRGLRVTSRRSTDRLPDADRQPRGRDAARARRAARGRRRRLRGHAPHAHAARPLRRQGAARQLPRAQRARARAASWSRGCARARSSRSSPTPACRWCPTPASCWCRPASRPGSRSRCCPGRPLRWRRWSHRAAGRPLALRRLPAAQALGAVEVLRHARDARRVRVSAAGRRVAGGARAVDPERPVAVCRELTKVHEEVVRGTAAELAARYATEPPRGEVVLVVGPAPAVPPETSAPALRRAAAAGRRRREAARAAGVVAELTGASANALYRALTLADSWD